MNWIPPTHLTSEQKQFVDKHLQTFDMALQPSNDSVSVSNLLIGLAVICRMTKDQQQAREMVIDMMTEVLICYPFDLVESAIKDCAKTCKFFPALSEILERVNPALARRKMARDRLCQLKRIGDNPALNGLITQTWRLEIMNGKKPEARLAETETCSALVKRLGIKVDESKAAAKLKSMTGAA